MRYRDCIYSLFPKEIKGLFKRNKTVPGSCDLVFQLLASSYHYFQLLYDLKHWQKNRECAFSFFYSCEMAEIQVYFWGNYFYFVGFFSVLSTWKNIGLVYPGKQRKLTEKATWKVALM